MSASKYGKLQTLINEVPHGCIIDGAWLEDVGIGRRNARAYVKSGWLERIAHGVYRRPFPNSSPDYVVNWDTVLRSLHWIMNYSIHIGGESALSHHGFNHDMPFRTTFVFVYGQPLPTWIDRIPCRTKFHRRAPTLFEGPHDLGLVCDNPSGDTVPTRWPLWYSTPERALLEALAEVPHEVDLYRVDKVVGSMHWISADRFNKLLQACTSFKVRRLFCVFAERHDHAWWPKINLQDLDLGKGERSLVRWGGKRHPKFRITLPPEFIGPELDYHLDGPEEASRY